ncbi:protein NUCLEAR FUSION DEFECTIVE 4-like [Papaver somniferum]|uniref:protein NUCLEAR FUSION DEFECTIVE 4-like n=1 Tax=Papaver somniferum TaxID=3469 RepID=UPI000E7020AD|nr:protein NUCLEAR FUSION DEFECTIVE 4-like [Papaver somniferum]
MHESSSSPSSLGKWLGFVTAIWVQAISGNNYTFSNYSAALKSLMSLTQLQLNNLSVAKDVGKAFGVLAGIASDRLTTPVILLIGSLEGLIGYGVQWLVVSRKIHPLPYWQMCIFLALGGNSTTWMNTAILVTCMRNFRKNRGPVSGILKGFVGLSTAIFTDVCSALFADSPSKFLLMLAIVPAVVCLTAIFFLREVPVTNTAAQQEEESKYLNFFNIVAVIVALYLLIYDLSGKHSHLMSLLFASGLLFLLVVSPLSIPLYSIFKNSSNSHNINNDDVETRIQEAETQTVETEMREKSVQVVVEEKDLETDDKVVEMDYKKPILGEDHTILEAVQTLDFWILFLSFLCGVGTGLAVMNNLGQMGLALGHADVSIFVSLTSIFGFFGRIGSGTISEYFLKNHATPRPLWNAASQIPMSLGYVVLAIALPGSLYVGSIVVGICYGVRLAITVPTASELFGLKYYGLIYNILILNLPLGSFLFSGLLAGFLYDAQATKTKGGGNTCVGSHCYRQVFVVMALSCVVGLVLDVVLVFRTKKLYKKIQIGKKSG